MLQPAKKPSRATVPLKGRFLPRYDFVVQTNFFAPPQQFTFLPGRLRDFNAVPSSKAQSAAHTILEQPPPHSLQKTDAISE